MKSILLRLLVIILFSPVIFSCKKSPAICSTNWATELVDELNAVSTALTVYYMDQSEDNCNALKAAYQDYIDALRPYGKCENLTGQSRTDWQSALDEAEASIDTIC